MDISLSNLEDNFVTDEFGTFPREGRWRSESATKELKVGILFSQYTFIALKGSFRPKEMRRST